MYLNYVLTCFVCVCVPESQKRLVVNQKYTCSHGADVLIYASFMLL